MSDCIRNKVTRNFAWAIAGKITNLVSGLVVGIAIARYLGPEQYGIMNYVISYVFLFQVVSVFGLDSIEVREIARNPLDSERILGSSIVLRFGLAIVCMLSSLIMIFGIRTDADMHILVAVYALSIPLNCFSVIRNYFTAIIQNEYVVKVEIVRTLIGMSIKALLLVYDATLFYFVTFSMFDYFLTASGYISAYHSKIGSLRHWQFDQTCAKKLLKESFPLLLTNAAVIVYQRIDQVMIVQMIDETSNGYFSVASRFVEILIYIPMVLAQTVMPVLVQSLNEGETLYLERAQRFMNLSIWLSVLAAVVTSLGSYWLIYLLFGKDYLPAVVILQILSFKVVSVALSNTAGAMLVAEGRQRYAIYRDGLGCITCVILNYLLLPRYGIVAAAFVAIASNVMAGYVADALIPSYRHLFRSQTKAIVFGWKDLPYALQMIKTGKL